MPARPVADKWKAVPGYEGLYEAARAGLIRSLRHGQPRLMKTTRHRDGYEKVNLFDRGGKSRTFHVHTLIALTFLGPRPPKHMIDHIDGNHENNSANNLRYVTAKESNENRKELRKSRQHTGHANVFVHGLGGYYVRVYVSKRLGRFATLEEAIAARDRFRNKRANEVENASEDGLQDGIGRDTPAAAGV